MVPRLAVAPREEGALGALRPVRFDLEVDRVLLGLHGGVERGFADVEAAAVRLVHPARALEVLVAFREAALRGGDVDVARGSLRAPL